MTRRAQIGQAVWRVGAACALALCFGFGLGHGLAGSPASAAIRSAKIASVSDDSNATKVQPSDLNCFTEPAVPAQNDIWCAIDGTSPGRTLALKFYDAGAWRTVASITY